MEACGLMRLLIAVTIYLTAVASLLIIGFSGIGALTNISPIRNVFASYAEFMPGATQPIGQGFICYNEYSDPMSFSSFYCIKQIDDDAERSSGLRFVSISGRNGVIRRTSFSVRLQYGTLVGWFGRARLNGMGRTMTLHWDGIQAYAGGRRNGWLLMTSPVRYMAFVGE